MSLNIAFDGYIYDSGGTLAGNTVSYQAFWYPNGTASSAAKWNVVRTSENSSYWNCNLGDADWLGQSGSALDGGIVLVVFWVGGADRTADCVIINEWSAFEVTLDGSSFYSNNVQTKPNILPTLSWSNNTPSTPIVDTSYSFTNNSTDTHQWDFNGVSMYHWYSRYGQTIFTINTITDTDYIWGDGTSDLNLSGAAGHTHSWDTAGIYTVGITITDACGGEVSDSVDVQVYWPPPVPNISRCDVSGNVLSNTVGEPDAPIYFKFTGTDTYDRLVSISWHIEDSGSYGDTDTSYLSTDISDIVAHTEGLGTSWVGHTATTGAFTNPGSHTVSVTIVWNDGWDDHTIEYSETFTQEKFAGPSVNFTQNPANAVTNQLVSFENTSTSINRVGLGLPDGIEYTWGWSSADTVDTISDVPYTYVLTKTPVSTECSVDLCAEWSDGWETRTTCTSKAVVFGAVVTVTPEDCYYIINVAGTSTDGTATGYGWTVYSGTSSSGVFNEVWSSPIGEEQNNKTICFSSTGWYKIEGTVYGNGDPTQDFDTLYINETCPDSGATYTIWNGTGELDTGADWVREGFGYESDKAVYEGTNGLLVVGATSADSLVFHRKAHTEIDINNYDFLSFWINIRSWGKSKDITINMYSILDNQSTELLMSNYINFNMIREWQRVMIPLKRFNIKQNTNLIGWPTYVNELKFILDSGINFWIDGVSLIMGELVTLPVCGTVMDADLVTGVPAMNTSFVPNMAPSPRTSPPISPFPSPKTFK